MTYCILFNNSSLNVIVYQCGFNLAQAALSSIWIINLCYIVQDDNNLILRVLNLFDFQPINLWRLDPPNSRENVQYLSARVILRVSICYCSDLPL